MNKTILLYSCFLLFGVFISCISQVMLKKSALKKYDSRIKEYLNPLVIFSYTIFFISTFLSILAYKEIPLSMGPVLESTSYIYITIFGAKFFGDKVTRSKVIAIVLILLGIFIYSI